MSHNAQKNKERGNLKNDKKSCGGCSRNEVEGELLGIITKENLNNRSTGDIQREVHSDAHAHKHTRIKT